MKATLGLKAPSLFFLQGTADYRGWRERVWWVERNMVGVRENQYVVQGRRIEGRKGGGGIYRLPQNHKSTRKF
ncbi:hypothetical protein SUGI_0518630 [Cryptomeria japonica]|nr:hypothetical protein SUGI_0518630 [Cryptomeria japonica]